MRVPRLLPYLAVVLTAVSCTCYVKSDLPSYGLEGNVSEMSVVVAEGELDYTVFFNRFGQIDSLVRYDAEGSIHDKEVYSYDRRHRRISISMVDSEGVQEGWYEYEYEGQFITKCTYYGMNSEALYQWEHLNDGKNIIETRCYMEGVLQYTDGKDYTGLDYEERQIDADGNQTGTVSVKQLAPDKPLSIVGNDSDMTFEYNEKGLPIHCMNAVLSSNGEYGWIPDLEDYPERWYRYSCDECGNWLTRTEHISPESPAVNTVTRIILYR